MTLNERIEANADLTLWCVHVLGPDDVYAAPSHDAAVVHARWLNQAVHGRNSTPRDILAFAYAAPWPHSKESHADDVKGWDTKVHVTRDGKPGPSYRGPKVNADE